MLLRHQQTSHSWVPGPECEAGSLQHYRISRSSQCYSTPRGARAQLSCSASEHAIELLRLEQASGEKSCSRRCALLGLAASNLAIVGSSSAVPTSEDTPRIGEVQHTEEEWRKLLTPAAYRVLRQAGTELPLSSPLYKEKRKGVYRCAGCAAALFDSFAKYDSGTGWPSFFEARDGATVELVDYSIPFYPRTEVRCKRCGSHIGHVFNDGPPPSGERFCMNGAALTFELAPASA